MGVGTHRGVDRRGAQGGEGRRAGHGSGASPRHPGLCQEPRAGDAPELERNRMKRSVCGPSCFPAVSKKHVSCSVWTPLIRPLPAHSGCAPGRAGSLVYVFLGTFFISSFKQHNVCMCAISSGLKFQLGKLSRVDSSWKETFTSPNNLDAEGTGISANTEEFSLPRAPSSLIALHFHGKNFP